MQTHEDEQIQPVPRHVRPATLQFVIVTLWVAVGLFTGAGIAATIGTVQAIDDVDLSVTEHVAEIGSHAGPWFIAAVVALAGIAVVEAVLITLGHVEHLEHEVDRPS